MAVTVYEGEANITQLDIKILNMSIALNHQLWQLVHNCPDSSDYSQEFMSGYLKSMFKTSDFIAEMLNNKARQRILANQEGKLV